MPKRLEIALQRRAQVLGLKGERRDAYVYGTMQKIKSRTVKKGAPPPGDYRGKVDNKDGTVAYT